MPPSPRDQLRHLVIADLGQQRCGPEIIDQSLDVPPCRICTSVMLTDLIPIPAGDVIQLGRRRGCCGLYESLRPVAFGPLEGFGLTPARASRRAVKANTFVLEVEMIERAVFVLVD